MALTKEELEELEALEKEESKAAEAKADAALRQKLDAKRMRKRLAAKHGEHGRDFVVVSTSHGMNIALRRPHDVEVDTLEEAEQSRPALEAFILELAIEPSKEDVRKHLAEFCGLAMSFAPHVNALMGRVHAEEAKK